jgi:asparagine N-glycosylation enzyme membrane subunit Stt3
MTRQAHGLGCCTTPSAVCFWAVMFGFFYGAGLLLATVWPAVQHYRDTVLLTALAAACVANFRRNRTLHCRLTGPLFLLGAIAALVTEAGFWRVDRSALWCVVLIGVGLAFLIEWRTVGRPGDSRA